MEDIKMNENHTYTLAELAERTGLTERTVRYYIEQVLPPHHKQGRGKLARYGQDTLNSIRFILLVRERYGIKPGQAKGVLADVPQETIDRVVHGEEELAVMTVPSAPAGMKPGRPSSLPAASARRQKYMGEEIHSLKSSLVMEDHPGSVFDQELSELMANPEPERLAVLSPSEPGNAWRTIFADGQVRIQCRGKHKLTAHQEEQIKAATKLIELALK
jgi:DNA-binding transcriptional MerR regulator